VVVEVVMQIVVVEIPADLVVEEEGQLLEQEIPHQHHHHKEIQVAQVVQTGAPAAAVDLPQQEQQQMHQIIQDLVEQVSIYQYLELLLDMQVVEAEVLLDHLEVLSPEELQLTAAVLVLLLMVLIFQHILAIMQRCPPAAEVVVVEVLLDQNQFIHKSYQRQVLVVVVLVAQE
jgi:hypothetical protein